MAHETVTIEEFKKKIRDEMSSTDDPLVKLRCALLLRGNSGIMVRHKSFVRENVIDDKGFSRSFRIMDDDENKKLNLEEFKKGIHDFKVGLSEKDAETRFKKIDVDNTGTIEFNELLKSLRPPMSQKRVALINQAFAKMDKTGEGVITADDMKGVYNANKHPKFLSGEKTEKEIFDMYLKSFEIGGNVDGKVTKEEFLNYYAGVSASIDNTVYFDLMMRNAWKI